MRIVFMGTPQFAVPSLEHLTLSQHEVVAVYTAPDKPAGRGRSLLPSPVKKAALALDLPVVQPVSLRPAGAVAQLADFHPEVIVVAAYGKLLPQSVLDIPRYGCLNIHPSLLPRYRARHRYQPPYWRAMPLPGSASCFWTKGWIPDRC